MSIEINVEQSPLTITPTNAEHIYTFYTEEHTLPDFKYIVDIYFKAEGLSEELASRLKVAPNSYGSAIMDVGEIVRTFLNANPRFEGETYPYLNPVAEENSIITLSDAQSTREYNAFNVPAGGVDKNKYLPLLWHVAQYRCVVGCEYTSGNTIVVDVDPFADFQPDYITIFPGVDNSLIPQPDLPYATLGGDYAGSSNFFQLDGQGWYYYDLFRHVYQRPGAKECHTYSYNNTNDTPVQISYITCNNEPGEITVNPSTIETFCALSGTPVIGDSGGCMCIAYQIYNPSTTTATINFYLCAETPAPPPDEIILLPGLSSLICTCSQTPIISDNPDIVITPYGICDGSECICTTYLVENTSNQEIDVLYVGCDGIPGNTRIAANQNFEICACKESILPNPNITITLVGNCYSCTCNSYTFRNNSNTEFPRVYWTDCDGNPQNTVLFPTTDFTVCACEGTAITYDGFVDIIDNGPCDFSCVCMGYSVMNNAFTGNATVTWLDCEGVSQSILLFAGQGLSFCACEGTVNSFDPFVDITEVGLCDVNRIIDDGLCDGYNPVKECPGPQEFMNAAGKTECAVVQADGKSFTNVRRRMHHPDCPMIVSFLNGKNDYFTNDIYSVAIRGALNHGDPYTFYAESENRPTQDLPLDEEDVNSTFKMLNFYLPYNVTSGNTLNAIPTNSQKVCFYGTSYNPIINNRLNMASATTEILEYWIQPKDCINEPVHILFMNGRGMWDTYTFGKKNTKKITLERKKYQQESSLDKVAYARGSSNRGQKIYEQNADYSWDCNTWFMDEADTTIMEEIFMSQDVFIITGTTIQNQQCPSEDGAIRLYQYLIPVVIKQTDFVEYQKQYQKIYQYNLTLEFGSVKRFRTQG